MFILPQIKFQKIHFLSEETISFHYRKHHQGYIDKTNKLLIGNRLATASLEDIVTHSEGELYDNAAQAWNHTFYWLVMSAGPADLQFNSGLAAEIKQQFGNMATLKEKFVTAAKSLFGSGWTWLAYDKKRNKLLIMNTLNAGNPMIQGFIPLLACDVWEHAYYLDYKNLRGDYVEEFWSGINWNFVAENFERKKTISLTSLMSETEERLFL